MTKAAFAGTIAPAALDRDGEALIAINNAEVPAVNAITVADLRVFAEHGAVIAAQIDGAIAGLLVLLPPGVPYESDNYAWFGERYRSFLYVDRVVVAPTAQGHGVGRALYTHAFDRVRERGDAYLFAEVNSRPPNPGSMAFHAKLGFEVLHERENPASGKRVVMQAWRASR